MQQIDASSLIRWFWLMLLSLLMGGLHQSYASTPTNNRRKGRFGETMVRIAGQIIEQASQRPVKNAVVMVRGGELALASKKTDGEGYFEFYIPAKKIASLEISLRINYQNHIFAKDDISPTSQDMLIYINGAVLLEANPMAEYSLPIHNLDDPNIGEVTIGN